MKQSIFYFLFLILPASLLAGPEITVTGNSKAVFGKYQAKQKKEFSFIIKNKGDKLLKITRIRNTCACADLKIGTKELEPGKETELKGTVRADSIYGKYNKKIYIQSNATNEKFLSLAIAGDAVPILKVIPDDKIYIGKVNKTWEKTFNLEPTEKSVELGEIVIKGSHKYNLNLEKQQDDTYNLKIKLKPPVKQGQIKTIIEIPIIKPTGWKPVKIVLQGRVVD